MCGGSMDGDGGVWRVDGMAVVVMLRVDAVAVTTSSKHIRFSTQAYVPHKKCNRLRMVAVAVV